MRMRRQQSDGGRQLNFEFSDDDEDADGLVQGKRGLQPRRPKRRRQVKKWPWTGVVAATNGEEGQEAQ